jgi:hypothetical protein
MIEIGIDALSQGELQVGALAKATVFHVIPLHLHPLKRSSDLTDWLHSWVSDRLLCCLSQGLVSLGSGSRML